MSATFFLVMLALWGGMVGVLVGGVLSKGFGPAWALKFGRAMFYALTVVTCMWLAASYVAATVFGVAL